MAQENTVSGSVDVKVNLNGDFDSQTSMVDTDLVAKFTKSILGLNPINLKIITGVYNPNNDEPILFTASAAGYKPGLIIFLSSNPVLLNMNFRDSINGATSRISALPVDGFLSYRPNLSATGSDLNLISLDGRTGIANEISQSIDIKYTLILLEDDSLAEG